MNYPLVFYPDFIEKGFNSEHFKESKKENIGISSKQDLEIKHQVIVKRPTKILNQLTQCLLVTWLVWLLGTIFGIMWAIAINFSFYATVAFLGSFSCLMMLVYLKLGMTYQQIKCKNIPDVHNPSNPIKNITIKNIKQNETDKVAISSQSGLLLKDLKPQAFSIGRSQARQGVSEEKFMKYLSSYFPKVTQAAEFELPFSKHNYSADFLIIHSPTGLGINCEIDEPYALRSKKPTHCCDQKEDHWRNQFFTERGWIVIRFSERQVVQAPLSCCKLIAQVIGDVTGDKSYLNQLKSEPDLLPERPWTTKDAKRRAKKNYRQSYLEKI